KRYKPVAKRKLPTPYTMPREANASFDPIPQLPLLRLPTHPPSLEDMPYDSRMTRERLEGLLAKVEPNTYSQEEINLLAWIMTKRSKAFAWTYEEKGTFRRDCYPDYHYLVRAHVPWVRPRIPLATSLRPLLVRELNKGKDLGKWTPSIASYRSALWAVAKKPGS
ncbi:hypothetical protein C8R42DRAFT_560060, partial [Lentinula raphanica]